MCITGPKLSYTKYMEHPHITVHRLTSYDPADAAGIGRLMPMLSDSFSSQPISEALLTEIIASDHHEQLVARLDSKIVGAATLSIIIGAGAGKKGWLEDFVSDQQAGVTGIGQAIWNEMGVWCQEHDIDLHFTSRPSRLNAHEFYARNGATPRHTTVFQKHF